VAGASTLPALDFLRRRGLGGDLRSHCQPSPGAQQSPLLLGLKSLKQHFGFGGAEVAGSAVPKRGRSRVSTNAAETNAVEKTRIKRFPQPDRSEPVSRIDGAFIKKTSRGNIANAQKRIPSCQKRLPIFR
jgi:hypothetical protein